MYIPIKVVSRQVTVIERIELKVSLELSKTRRHLAFMIYVPRYQGPLLVPAQHYQPDDPH